jgi:hypothetical protein
MNRQILVSRRRGPASDPATWLFPLLILLSALLPLPLFVLTAMSSLALLIRRRAGPAAAPAYREPLLRPLRPRGPPL